MSDLIRRSIKKLAPLIWVTDIQKSIDFYCQILGFSHQQSWSPHGNLRWCLLDLGPVTLMLQQSNRSLDDQHKENIELYVICDELELLHQLILSKGGQATPISQPFYKWRQFFVSDPDGHEICFETPPSD